MFARAPAASTQAKNGGCEIINEHVQKMECPMNRNYIFYIRSASALITTDCELCLHWRKSFAVHSSAWNEGFTRLWVRFPSSFMYENALSIFFIWQFRIAPPEAPLRSKLVQNRFFMALMWLLSPKSTSILYSCVRKSSLKVSSSIRVSWNERLVGDLEFYFHKRQLKCILLQSFPHLPQDYRKFRSLDRDKS